ncbi:MAG: hypothetical protein LCH46_06325 [Proteobacteria bacterium]|nr:hypothetical protein [Pseudomonadota bacterium]
MENYRYRLMLAGPVLLFFAAFILPGSNFDPEARINIMKAFAWRWQIGHGLMLASCLLMLVWLEEVSAVAFDGARIQAVAGALIFAFAVMAESTRAVLQLFSVEMAFWHAPDAQPMLENMNASFYLIGLVFAPALAYSVGAFLLGWGLLNAGRTKKQFLLLLTAGLFLTAGGLLEFQFLDWIAAFALLTFTWLHVHTQDA